ncbi:MAG: segregation/condensation protein A [Clostridiales Family XIII bacterium]|jgi:segregation and condensation protein A|nr:segregation/condensation protein A [Clostridiales Family XIII bacterium]
MSYKVKLQIFEGPFDLLVYLIENAEMSIYDIRVSEITSQYIRHIEMMQERDVMVGAEFLVLAATLIELKSKMLLPRIKADGAVEEDPRAELAQKLLEYTQFKKLAAALEEQMDLAAMKLVKPKEDLAPYTGEPDEYLNMDRDRFIAAFKAFIHRKRKQGELAAMQSGIERERMTVSAKQSAIRHFLRRAKGRLARFRDLLLPDSDRYDKVVTFVSLLEMIKSGVIGARQEGNFKEIEVEWKPQGRQAAKRSGNANKKNDQISL